jgi:hypothetical protein
MNGYSRGHATTGGGLIWKSLFDSQIIILRMKKCAIDSLITEVRCKNIALFQQGLATDEGQGDFDFQNSKVKVTPFFMLSMISTMENEQQFDNRSVLGGQVTDESKGGVRLVETSE